MACSDPAQGSITLVLPVSLFLDSQLEELCCIAFEVQNTFHFGSQSAEAKDVELSILSFLFLSFQTEETPNSTKVESPAAAPADADGFKSTVIKAPTGGYETLPGVKARGEEFKYGEGQDANVFKGGRAQVRAGKETKCDDEVW